jgi:hypothetical protein
MGVNLEINEIALGEPDNGLAHQTAWYIARLTPSTTFCMNGQEVNSITNLAKFGFTTVIADARGVAVRVSQTVPNK